MQSGIDETFSRLWSRPRNTGMLAVSGPGIAAFLGLVFFLGQAACHKKPVCERLAAKNKACAEAFDRYVQDKADRWNQAHPIPRASAGPSAKPEAAPPKTIGESAKPAGPSGGAGAKGAKDKGKALTRAEAIRRMRLERRKAAKKGIRELFTGDLYLEACRKAWSGTAKEDERLKKAARDCLAVSDCDAYVACIMKLERQPTKTTLKPAE